MKRISWIEILKDGTVWSGSYGEKKIAITVTRAGWAHDPGSNIRIEIEEPEKVEEGK